MIFNLCFYDICFHIITFNIYFLLLLHSLFSHPWAQLLHSPCFLSHVSLFKQFPLHSCLQLIPNVPFLHAIVSIFKKNIHVLLVNITFEIKFKNKNCVFDYRVKVSAFTYVNHIFLLFAILPYTLLSRYHLHDYMVHEDNSHIHMHNHFHKFQYCILKLKGGEDYVPP